MRLGELCNLKLEDVDLNGGALTIKKSKTEAGERVVILPDHAIGMLHGMYSKRRPGRSDYVFLGKTEKKIYEKTMSKDYLRSITKKSGLPRMLFHNLRHTHATWLAASDFCPTKCGQSIAEFIEFKIMLYNKYELERSNKLNRDFSKDKRYWDNK